MAYPDGPHGPEVTVHRGHNNPPGMIDTAGDVTSQLNIWMTDNPVIETEDKAHDAKILIDRAKLCFKDLDDERTKRVRPLNLQVDEINASYRAPRGILLRVTQELLNRVTSYLGKEEAKRIKAAEEARKKAEEAEQAARDAEAREAERLDDARHGAEVDVAAAAKDADEAYQEYRVADRAALRAERESKVRVGGGFSRSLSLRNKETLVVTDHIAAIEAIGLNLDLVGSIIKSARAYRTIHGKLPPGIESKIERSA